MALTPKRRRWSLALVLVLLICVGGILAVRQWQKMSASEYRSFTSPDGQYRVVVLSVPSLLPLTPGHGGDARGFVQLCNRDGEVLRESPVDMVQTVQSVEWKAGRVTISRFADWPLPRD